MMEFSIFFIFCVNVVLAAPPPTKIKQTFLGKPTGMFLFLPFFFSVLRFFSLSVRLHPYRAK